MARASLGILIALAALQLGACTQVRLGEFGEVACHDRLDNDGDGRKDCLDPDCLGTEVCRKSGVVEDISRFDAGSLDTGTISAVDAGKMDAGKARDSGLAADTSTPRIPDAGPDDDGGAPADGGSALCNPPCTNGDVCVEGQCQPAMDQVQAYTLTIESAMAPRVNSTNECYDTECLDPPSTMQFGICTCLVDPFVRAIVVHLGADTQVRDTQAVMGTLYPTFDEHWDIVLAPGDKLRFEVWDQQDLGPNNKLYECMPSLRNIPGSVSCAYIGSGANLAIPFQVNASLSLPSH